MPIRIATPVVIVLLILILIWTISSRNTSNTKELARCNFIFENLRLHGYITEKVSDDPYIIVIRNLLPKEHIDHVINLASNRFQRSTVIGNTGREISEYRTSSSCMLEKAETDVIHDIEKRVCHITGYTTNNLEQLQIVRYLHGQKYDPHFDYFPRDDPNFRTHVGTSGQRTITMFIYLITPEEGGETYFPEIDLKVKVNPGDAVLWYDVHNNGLENPKTLHGGLPVEKGNKMAINVWFRDQCTLWI